jgi:threonine synthase
MKKRLSPARYFSRFLSSIKPNEILDFGLSKTPLISSSRLAEWLGVSACYLKLETSHPTETVKDRITEISYSFFKIHGVTHYAHCSAGNTATSLVWGMEKFNQSFNLEVFIPEDQLSYHNFRNIPGLTTILVEGAGYEEAKQYCSWYSKTILQQPEYLNFHSSFRREANKIPYLEAFKELAEQGIRAVDYVCQTISDGTGIIAGEEASRDALSEGWLRKKPAFVVAQPEAANPVVRCFNHGFDVYDQSCSLKNLGESKAFAVRRKDASVSYPALYEVLKQAGYALDATEEEIEISKEVLFQLEGIEAGYTACTALAALKRKNDLSGEFKNKSVLVMITGRDRPYDFVPSIDRIVRKSDWQKVVKCS